MAAYFLDSSALVKRYAREIGTSWVLNLVRPATGNRLYLARITGVEVISALTRRARGGMLKSNTADKAANRFEREFANRFLAVDVTPKLIREAMNLAKKHALRGYDAIQLAAAIEAHQKRNAVGATPITLISADDALNVAAQTEGLLIDNPNSHP